MRPRSAGPAACGLILIVLAACAGPAGLAPQDPALAARPWPVLAPRDAFADRAAAALSGRDAAAAAATTLEARASALRARAAVLAARPVIPPETRARLDAARSR